MNTSPVPPLAPGPGEPTPPIALAAEPSPSPASGAAGSANHFGVEPVEVSDALVAALEATGASVTTEEAERREASRDWWPLAMTWAADGQVAGVAGAVVRPDDASQVPEILARCNEERVPVTAAAGRSGVCGSSIPLYGGVVLDLCGLSGITSVDDESLVVDVQAGTFGDRLEAELQGDHGFTVGHWPQSMTLSTVGGWLACRGAGQLSNKYGKIEDIVVGMDVVLADGTTLTTGGNARQAVGPDLNQLFVGSEGTLGVITGARLRLHPVATHTRRGAWGFASFAEGLEACRRLVQRGIAPAVLRLYDSVEADRNYQTGDLAVLLVLDEGDPVMVDAAFGEVTEECSTALRLDDELVERWLGHRNDVSALERLIGGGLVVDTMEVTGPWAALPAIYEETVAAISEVPGTLAASAHQSHAYTDGACLYFTFGGKVEPEERDEFYRAVWDAGTRTVLARGGSLSHHHGVGINRARFVREALGGGFDMLAALKSTLDPNGILNPGKLGLPSPFGDHPFAS